MSDERTPATGGYDAVVGMANTREDGPVGYALVKITWDVSGSQMRVAPAEPLEGDLSDEELDPRLPAATDFWPFKEATDFVVRGSAWAPPEQRGAVDRMVVGARIGTREKQVAVHGDRLVRWDARGGVHFGAPEPFEEIPVTWENAYGGIDWRVPVENADDPAVAAMLLTDHPGMYPRNPFGKGYLVEEPEVEDLFLPNVEDPADLLTPDRLRTGDPRLWWRQPRPCGFDWTHPATFPRYCWLGAEVDAWFPGPQDATMPEVRLGTLPERYRDLLARRRLSEGPHPWFKQGGSAGFVIPRPEGGEPVVVWGMHPERSMVSFYVPREVPRIALAVEGDVLSPPPRLHHLVCRPADERVTMTWAVSAPLPRVWLPGIHGRIPIAVSVHGEDWIEYETPPTLPVDRVGAAQDENVDSAGVADVE